MSWTDTLVTKAHVRHATKSSKFITPLCMKLPRQLNFPSANKRQTNMACSDTDDDIIISSTLLIVSMLHQRRQVNVRKCKTNSWARKQSQLGDRARNCRRI